MGYPCGSTTGHVCLGPTSSGGSCANVRAAYLMWDEVNRRLLGGKGSSNKSTAVIAGILGRSELWVREEKARLLRIVKEEYKTKSPQSLPTTIADFETVRKEIELQVRTDEERKRQAAIIKVRHRHNNQQCLFRDNAQANGFRCVTEKNFIDLLLPGTEPNILIELKVDHAKGDVEHAFGHLVRAKDEWKSESAITALLVLHPLGKKDVDWLTSHSVSIIVGQDGKYSLQNRVFGHQILQQVISQVPSHIGSTYNSGTAHAA